MPDYDSPLATLHYPAPLVDSIRRRLGHKMSRLMHSVNSMIHVCERLFQQSVHKHPLVHGAAVLPGSRKELTSSHQRSCLISRGRLCNRILHPFHGLATLVRLPS